LRCGRLRRERQDAKTAKKEFLIARFLSSRALRAGARKSAARRPVWQAGDKWVRFARFLVATGSWSYPFARAEIALDPPCVGAIDVAVR
jgi:hypothetical protein